MDLRITAKLFHTVVVVGMGLAATGCGGDDSPPSGGNPEPSSNTNTSASVASNTDAGHVDAATPAPAQTSHGGDSMPSWSCCA